MGVIHGSLIRHMSDFHLKNQAELADIVIDSEYQWNPENSDSAAIRRKSQQDVLTKAKELNCRTICVRNRNIAIPSHIRDVINEPDFIFNKQKRGICHGQQSTELINYLQSHCITTAVVMGGILDRCVYLSMVGDNRIDKTDYRPGEIYPGLLSCGYTVLTSPTLLYNDLSPHHEHYSVFPKFSPDAVCFQEQNPADLVFSQMLNRDWQWPVFTFQKGMRIYTDV